MSTRTLRIYLSVPMLVMLALLAAGCRPLVRTRTLPASVRSVHVPMILNRTSEPGIEERLTVEVQKELLADGRLNIVKRKEADAIIQITLSDFDRRTTYLDGDDFPVGQAYRLDLRMNIQENIPGLPTIGNVRPLSFEGGFNPDTRTIGFDAEPDRLDAFYRGVARNIVLELLTGEYSGTPLQRDVMNENAQPVTPTNIIR
jgi:hypothetical protein